MNTYKLIIGQKACAICQGIGVTFNPVKICGCAGLLDVTIPDDISKTYRQLIDLIRSPATQKHQLDDF